MDRGRSDKSREAGADSLKGVQSGRSDGAGVEHPGPETNGAEKADVVRPPLRQGIPEAARGSVRIGAGASNGNRHTVLLVPLPQTLDQTDREVGNPHLRIHA